MATHTSSTTPLEFFVYRDRSDDGGPKPLREALRFASIAPHNLPCRERFAGRFSEGVLPHVRARRCFYKPQLLFRYPPRATRNKGHTYRQSKVYSRNCSNISIGRGKRQPGFRGNVTKQLLARGNPTSSPRIDTDERGLEPESGQKLGGVVGFGSKKSCHLD